MTAVAARLAATRPSRDLARPAAVAAGGCALLLGRPVLSHVAVDPTALLVVLFALLLAAGLLWPEPRVATTVRRATVTATATLTAVALGVGALALLAGRVVAGAHAAGPATMRFVILNSFAAVAEEAFFRRFLQGWLERYGQGVAVVLSASLFAIVHVTVYGPWVLAIDLAAGLLFAWQRSVTGSWRASALTHVVANLLAVL